MGNRTNWIENFFSDTCHRFVLQLKILPTRWNLLQKQRKTYMRTFARIKALNKMKEENDEEALYLKTWMRWILILLTKKTILNPIKEVTIAKLYINYSFKTKNYHKSGLMCFRRFLPHGLDLPNATGWIYSPDRHGFAHRTGE